MREIECFAFGGAFGDVKQNNVAQLFDGCEVSERAADLTCADERDFGSGHWKVLRSE